jgi:hypothetical protein
MKGLLTIIFTFLIAKTFACSCITVSFADQYLRSDFIAVAKIVSIYAGEANTYYSDIEIDIITLYKGNPVTKLKMENPLKSGCGVNAPVNSVWLIYAGKTADGGLAFNYCSAPIRLDQVEAAIYDDKYKIRHQEYVSRTFKLLNFLKEANLSLNAETTVWLNLNRKMFDSLKGYEEPAYNFSAFELLFNTGSELEEIKVLKEFNNKILAKQIKNGLTQATIKEYGKSPIEKKERRFLVLLFFYPPEKEYQSFVSYYFL